MRNIKIYQSSKYDNARYKIVNYIYYYDSERGDYCLPLVGKLDKEDDADIILTLLSDKFWLFVNYSEVIQIGNTKLLLFELCGEMKALVEASNIIGKNIIAIYFKEKAMDLLIE